MEKDLGRSKRIARSAVEHEKKPQTNCVLTVNRQCVDVVRGRRGIFGCTEPVVLRRGNTAPARQDRPVSDLQCGYVSLEGEVTPIAPERSAFRADRNGGSPARCESSSTVRKPGLFSPAWMLAHNLVEMGFAVLLI